MKYLVSWKGYGPADNSWEPEKALQQHAEEALDEYWDKVAIVQAAQGTDSGLAQGTDSGLAAAPRAAQKQG